MFLFAFIAPLQAQGTDSLSIKKDSIQTVSPTKGNLQTPIRYEAQDSIVMDIASGKATLYNTASVKMESMELKAKYIEVGLSSKLLFAKGGPDSSGKYSELPIFSDGAKK